MVGLKNPKYKGKAPFTFVQELFDKCLYPYELSDKQLAGEVRLHFFIDTYGQMFFLPSRFFPYPKAQDPESPLVSQTDPFDELMMISAIEQVIDYNAIWSPVEDTAGQKYPMECFCCIPVSSHKSLIPLALYCRIQIEDFIPDDVIGVPSAFYLRFMFRNPKIY